MNNKHTLEFYNRCRHPNQNELWLMLLPSCCMWHGEIEYGINMHSKTMIAMKLYS